MSGNEPDYFRIAADLAKAVMFQRATRKVHVVGKDGRVRLGCVDLLGCYAVDEAARELCSALGEEFREIEPPTEGEAMFMLGRKLTWRSWMADAAGVRLLASGMSAGTAETPQAAQGEARQPDPKGDAQPKGGSHAS